MRRLLTIAILAAAVGSGSAAFAGTPAAGPVQVAGDKFSKEITFLGPSGFINPFAGTTRTWRIRSFLDRQTKAVSHQLYAEISYTGDWRWYEAASDDHAESLATTRIASNAGSCWGGCSLSETVGVMLPDALLRSRVATGFEVKLSAKDGSALVLTLTPAMVAAQLAAVDAYLGEAATAHADAVPLPPPPFGADFTSVGGFSKAMLKIGGGALVSWVSGNTVASRAGLHWADVIVAFDEAALTGADDLRARLAAVKAGQHVKLSVIRGRTPIDLAADF